MHLFADKSYCFAYQHNSSKKLNTGISLKPIKKAIFIYDICNKKVKVLIIMQCTLFYEKPLLILEVLKKHSQ